MAMRVEMLAFKLTRADGSRGTRIDSGPSSASLASLTFSNNISSETARPIETKFNVEPPWGGETKISS